MKTVLRAVVLALAATLACRVFAQGYPSKPIRLIVPTPAGTSPDNIGRILGDKLMKVFNQPVLVENITGAGGLIASQTAARAAPDGYTLYFSGTGALITDRYTQKSPGYDADRDFVLVSMIYEEGSLAIAVHPDVQARNLPELIALARSQPGKLSYSTTSVALLILFGEWFQKQAGVDMVAVPYKSAAQQFQDTIAGRVHMLISAPPQLDPFRKAGKLRVLAVDGARRYPPWPDVPNIYETLPGWRMSGMGVLAAPRGTALELVQQLNRTMDKVVRDPDYVQRLLGMGFTINGAGTPESIAAFVRERREYWDKVMKGLNVQPQ